VSTLVHVGLLVLFATVTLTVIQKVEQIRVKMDDSVGDEFDGLDSLDDLAGVLKMEKAMPQRAAPSGPAIRNLRAPQMPRIAGIGPKLGRGPTIDASSTNLSFGGGGVGGLGGSFGDYVGGLRKVGLDIALVIDTSSSMQFVIDDVRNKLSTLVAAIHRMVPTARIGIVVYRDTGDEYVVKWTDLSFHTDKLTSFLKNITADGGGDFEEAVLDAVDTAIHELSWRKRSKRAIILVGGSPPHKWELEEVVGLAEEFRGERGRLSAIDVTHQMHTLFDLQMWRAIHGMKEYQPSPMRFYRKPNASSRNRQRRRRSLVMLGEDKSSSARSWSWRSGRDGRPSWRSFGRTSRHSKRPAVSILAVASAATGQDAAELRGSANRIAAEMAAKEAAGQFDRSAQQAAIEQLGPLATDFMRLGDKAAYSGGAAAQREALRPTYTAIAEPLQKIYDKNNTFLQSSVQKVIDADGDLEALQDSEAYRNAQLVASQALYFLNWLNYYGSRLYDGKQSHDLLDRAQAGFSEFAVGDEHNDLAAESLLGRGLCNLELGNMEFAVHDLAAVAKDDKASQERRNKARFALPSLRPFRQHHPGAASFGRAARIDQWRRSQLGPLSPYPRSARRRQEDGRRRRRALPAAGAGDDGTAAPRRHGVGRPGHGTGPNRNREPRGVVEESAEPVRQVGARQAAGAEERLRQRSATARRRGRGAGRIAQSPDTGSALHPRSRQVQSRRIRRIRQPARPGHGR
jgi:hypothetical protein